MRFREYIEKMNRLQDGTRTMFESIAIPEVAQALKDWNVAHKSYCVVIGGCAASYHSKPRATTDLDVLYLSQHDIPSEVVGFKKHRPRTFLHQQTHVEVEVVHPTAINISSEMAKAVFDSAEIVDGVRVASPSGIVALKLHRLKNHDVGDIVAMHNTGKVDISKFPLTQKHIDDYNEVISKYA